MRRLSHFGDEKPARCIWSSPRPTWTATAQATSSGPFSGTPSVLALSGKDGSLLWTYSADPGGPAPAGSAEEVPHSGSNHGRAGGGRRRWRRHPDLIAEFVIFDDPKGLGSPSGKANRSGRGSREILARPSHCRGRIRPVGKELWNHVIDREIHGPAG